MVKLLFSTLMKILYNFRISNKITVQQLIKTTLLCFNINTDNYEDSSYFHYLKCGKVNVPNINDALMTSYFEALKKVKDSLCPLLDNNKYINIICCVKEILIKDNIDNNLIIGFYNHSYSKLDIINEKRFCFEDLLCNLLYYCIVQIHNRGYQNYIKNINDEFFQNIIIDNEINIISNTYQNYIYSNDLDDNIIKLIIKLLKETNIEKHKIYLIVIK